MAKQEIERLLKDIAEEFYAQECEEMVKKADGYKEDTLILDVFFETKLINGLLKAEKDCVAISEETGKIPNNRKITNLIPVYFLDPIDMSNPLKAILSGKKGKVGEVLSRQNKEWLNAPTSFITRVYNGNAETYGLNVFSSELFSNALIINTDSLFIYTNTSGEHAQRNLKNLGLTEKVKHAEEGPHRILYLNQAKGIMSNGEKITEWIHWLEFINSSNKVFSVYRFSYENSPIKKGFSYAPYPAESPIESRDRKIKLNIENIEHLMNPALHRETLLITSGSNFHANYKPSLEVKLEKIL